MSGKLPVVIFSTNHYLGFKKLFQLFAQMLVSTGNVQNGTYSHGPLNKYVILWVAHAPIMRGTFYQLQRKPPVNDPCMHHGSCVTLTRLGGENVPGISVAFYVLCKRPMADISSSPCCSRACQLIRVMGT